MKLLEVLKMKSRIRLLRERKRMSQLMLGREIGVSQQIISRIENDISTLSIDLLVNLANYFNVTTDYLLGLERKYELDLSGLTQAEIDALLNLIKAMKHN